MLVWPDLHVNIGSVHVSSLNVVAQRLCALTNKSCPYPLSHPLVRYCSTVMFSMLMDPFLSSGKSHYHVLGGVGLVAHWLTQVHRGLATSWLAVHQLTHAHGQDHACQVA